MDTIDFWGGFSFGLLVGVVICYWVLLYVKNRKW